MAGRTRRKGKPSYLEALMDADPPNLYKRKVDDYIGFGLFTSENIEMSSFIAEYKGDLISADEADRKENHQYMFYFKHDGSDLCVDAYNIKHSGIARFANDDWRKPNSRVVKEVVDGRPVLFLKALRNIRKDEQIMYDYGDTSAPWRCAEKPELMISQFSQHFNIRCDKKFSEATTHLAMKCNQDGSRIPERTWKYFQAVANGIIIVDYQWVVDSLNAGAMLSEIDYEIIGDTVLGKHFGPRKSRLGSRNLFASFRFHLVGFSNDGIPSVDDVSDLICICGGQVGGQENKRTLIDLVHTDYDRHGLQIDPKVPSISIEWLYDCISSYTVEPFEDYFLNEEAESSMQIDVGVSGMAGNEPSFEVRCEDNHVDAQEKENKAESNMQVDVEVPGATEYKASPEVNESCASNYVDAQEKERQAESNMQVDAEVPGATEYKASPEVNESYASNYVDAQEKEHQAESNMQVDAEVPGATEYKASPEVNESYASNYVDAQEKEHQAESNMQVDAEVPGATEYKASPEVNESYASNYVDAQEKEHQAESNMQVDVQVPGATEYEASPEVNENCASNYVDAQEKEHQAESNMQVDAEVPGATEYKASPEVNGRCANNAVDSQEKETLYSDEACSSPSLNDHDSDSSFQMPSDQNDTDSDTDSVHQEESFIEPSDNSEAESDVFPYLKNEVKVMDSRRKKHACLFCEKTYSRISRHYQQRHSSEIKVAKILAIKVGSKERKESWMQLVNEGDFKHNYEVLESKKGEIIPKYRQVSTKKQTEQYIPCNFCLGLYGKAELWRHQKKCKAADPDEKHKERGKGVQSGKLMLPIDSKHKNLHAKILINMRDDTIKAIVLQDPLVLEFGERLFEKCGHKPHQHQYISQKLRELARVIGSLKSQSNIKSLEEGMNPKNWNSLILAVKAVAGYDESSNSFEIPSLPLKIGHSLSKCAKILKTQGIMDGDDEKKQQAQNFLELYEAEWSERLSRKALETLHERKFNQPLLLPLAQDVTLLFNFLQKKIEDLKQSIEHYSEFAECILAQVILFNRKRSGEAQRIEMKHIQKGLQNHLNPADKEILATLSTFEQELLKTHTRVEVMGKKGSKVPVLLTADMLKNIEILVKYRKELKIDSEYLFIKPNSRFPIRGDSCMSKFSRECGAKNPELFRSTKLRKHLGTMCQVLGLSSEHLELLASFMGHTLNIHKGFYRLPEDTLQTAKLSKVLHLINTGGIAKYKGKTFDDIEFSPEDPVPEDSDEDDSEGESDADSELGTDGEPEAADEIESDAESESLQKTNKSAVGVKRKLPCRKPWSSVEEAAVLKHLGRFINSGKLPGKRECEAAKAAEPRVLKERSWTLIKNFIRNRITSRARKMKAAS